MQNDKEFLIRIVEPSDLDNLIIFFKKAYGKHTVFQNIQFLQYYFSCKNKKLPTMSACMIGLDSGGQIVSHYGGLFYEMKTNNKTHNMVWGVNAYTLPEWRGKGINSAIINYIIKNTEIHGVIGFTKKTASFYEQKGYNIFSFQKFTRYVLILDNIKTKKTVAYIEQDIERLNMLFENQSVKNPNKINKQVVELNSENIRAYELRLDDGVVGITTTGRTQEFLIWRIFNNPFIKYKVFGFVQERKILAYVVLREEILNPLGYKINRIVDLYGEKEGVSALLLKIIQESILKRNIYIDFSMFGSIYNEELASSGFIKLENDDCCIFPQVTAPITNRHNNEYIGLISKNHDSSIANLTKKDVYFTRIDSDRDRLGRISQIKQRANKND